MSGVTAGGGTSPLGMIWGGKAIGERIGKTPRQTFYLLETGQIPARKVGDQWVTTERALQSLADSITDGSGAAR